MTDRVVRVKLEGDGASLDAAMAKSTSGANKLDAAVRKSGKGLDTYDQATKRAVTSTEKLTTSKVKASQVAMALGKAANTAKGGMLDVANAAASAVSAFGPWGVAVGLAAGALIGYASNASAAAEETRKLERELGKQRSRALDRALDEKKEEMARRSANAEANKAERDRLKIMETANDLKEIENALAQHGRGKDTLALQKEETRIRAENLRIQGDAVGAAQAERDFELHTLEILGRKDKARKGKASGPMFKALSLENSAISIERDGSDSRDFASEMAAANGPGQMQRAGSDARMLGEATAIADEKLRAIEIERATVGETIELVNRERDARLALLDVQMSATSNAAERADITSEIEQTHHEARMQRIAVEQAAEQAQMQKRIAYQNMAASLANDSVQLGNNIAKLSGASAKKREKIERALGAGQAIVIGSLELVKAAAAYAQPFGVGIPEGIAHTAAAVTAFSTAAVLGTGAGSSGGGGASAGASSPSGGSQTPRSGSVGNDSPIPGSPGPQSPSTGTGGTKFGGSKVVNMYGPVYGVPPKDFVRAIDEGLADLDYDRKPRRETG